MILTLLAAAAWGACSAEPDALEAEVDAGLAAYQARDVDAFIAVLRAAEGVARCLVRPLSPSEAAGWHGLAALGAFLTRDTEAAVAHFRGALAADPRFEVPVPVIEGHPLQRLYAQAVSDPSASRAVVIAPPGVVVFIDGAEATMRAADRSAIVQLTAADGAMLWSGVVAAGAPLPSLADLAPSNPVSSPEPPTADARPRRSPAVLPLWLSAASVGVLAGGLYAGAWSTKARYDAPSTPFGELEGMRRRTNALSVGAGVAGGAAVGLGAAALVVTF